jgi:hypothetical protein
MAAEDVLTQQMSKLTVQEHAFAQDSEDQGELHASSTVVCSERRTDQRCLV